MIYPKVSIIIVNYNQKQLTIDCLKSLLKITYPNYEIILVDNGSSDGSYETLKKFTYTSDKITIVRNQSNLGFAGGNNVGLKKSSGKYVLLLNNDTKVENNFIEPLIKAFQNNSKLGILQSKIFVMGKLGVLDNVVSYQTITGFLYHKGYLEKDKRQYSKFLHSFSTKGAAMLIDRRVLKLGLFDDDYFAYFEETDLCWRAWLMGFEVGFEPKSVVYHKMGVTSLLMDSFFIQYHSFKNRIRTILKNASIPTLAWMLPIHLVSSLGLSLFFLVTGKVKAAKSVYNAYWWNITNFQKTLNLRNKIQGARKVSDQEIFRHTLRNPPLGFYKRHLSLLTRSWK